VSIGQSFPTFRGNALAPSSVGPLKVSTIFCLDVLEFNYPLALCNTQKEAILTYTVVGTSKSLYIQEEIDSDFGKFLTLMIQNFRCFFSLSKLTSFDTRSINCHSVIIFFCHLRPRCSLNNVIDNTKFNKKILD